MTFFGKYVRHGNMINLYKEFWVFLVIVCHR